MPALRRVEAKGMTCWSDSLRTVGYGDVVVLSMFGDRNAVRAAWATIFNRKRWPCVRVGESSVSRREGEAYSTIQQSLGRGLLHVVIVALKATRMGSTFESSFYQLGPQADDLFFSRLTQRCRVPMRPSWQPEIWKIGVESSAIRLLPGYGLPCYEVDTSTDTWGPLIKDALCSGRLS